MGTGSGDQDREMTTTGGSDISRHGVRCLRRGTQGPGRRCSVRDGPQGSRLGELTLRLAIWNVKDPRHGSSLEAV